jgi:exonuclease SbcC
VFAGLFKAGWQHRDAAVREKAVAKLDPAREQDRDILATLARGDAEASVRAAAARQLSDLQLLDQIIENDPDDSVRRAATRQVEALLAGTVERAPGLENRLRLIHLTDHAPTLYYVASESPDVACREAALDRLDDPDLLLELALAGKSESQRVQAAGRLSSAHHLKRLTREGRDKRVLQTARESLKQRQAEEAERTERLKELDELESRLDTLSRQTPDHLYAAQVQQLQQRRDSLAEHADNETGERLEKLLAECADNAHRWQEQREEATQRDNAGSEQQAAVDTLSRMIGELTADSWENLGSLRALVDTQKRRWQNSVEYVTPPTDLAERFAQQTDHLEELIRIADELAQRQSDLEALLARAEHEDIQDELTARLPDWPANVAAPLLLVRLREKAGKKEVVEAPAAPSRNEDAHRVLGALARELRKRNLRHANRLWRKALALLEEHPDKAATARMEKLRPDLQELQDWHQFAAEPKKEALCQRMEQLAGTDMEAEEKATAIQALHEEWRDLMSSDQELDQTLWDRFKAASDQAYEPCREHFRELDAKKAENLAQRERLCQQLADFIAAQDWDHAEWPAVWEIRQTAPTEWKQYAPVRFTDAREVQQRFSALLSELDEKLQAATDAHREKRDRILEELEKLTELDDTEAAARDALALQEQWKQADWVHPNIYRGMNRRFRRLNDRIFGARNANRDQRREEAKAKQQALEAALSELEPLLQAPPAELDLAVLQEKLDQVMAEDCPPSAKALMRRRDDARSRFNSIRRNLPRWRRWQEHLAGLQALPSGEAGAEQRQLAVALEVLAGVESPEDARDERMAWQLEKLPKAMTAGAEGDALEEVFKLLDNTGAESLDDAIRNRLVVALKALEPSL